MNSALRVEARAQRLLPTKWFSHDTYFAPPDDDHWIRTPFEFRVGRNGKVQWRLVELQIDDLAALILGFGLAPVFWLIKDSTKAAPRWVLPIGAASRSTAAPSRGE